MNLDFYCDKKILVTGHTGFKGSWLCRMLLDAGACVVGYSLDVPEEPNIYEMIVKQNELIDIRDDIRNFTKLDRVLGQHKPEIVFHLAAQALVSESYIDPRHTFETNFMGTVNVLEGVRQADFVRSVVIVTTDKVYENKEWDWGYREVDVLNGYDPYSNSKSCAELAADSYRKSFFNKRDIPISTVRAGNVIGGGDFAKNRIIPDCFRAASKSEKIKVRNPDSVRPYQHVLEPLTAYLLLAERQFKSKDYAGAYNIGPDQSSCIMTQHLVQMFCDSWGDGLDWTFGTSQVPQESHYLALDNSKIKHKLGWQPKWGIEKTIEETVKWYKAYLEGQDVYKLSCQQIKEFLG